MAKNMTRPGGETSENPTRSWGGAANANTTRQADAQVTGRTVNIANSAQSAGLPKVQSQSRSLVDYGGDGVPLGGTYEDAKKGK